ncbi:MAG: rRNA pseudouridine synthase [Ignavibacteria bacterium]|nr:rRNA pseudouridine synthase [Ignavibacteria bacterium]
MNKFLSECGIASRRKSEEYIKEGRITVNGRTVLELSLYVDESTDLICLDGEKIKPMAKVYFLLNKPKGYITTTEDERRRKKVTDLINTKQKIFPVGRLDYDTTGLLLLTNDGEFSNFITHPSNGIIRTYSVSLNRKLSEEDRLTLMKGIMLDGRKSKFASIKYVTKNIYDKLIVTTVEGRNHFVKRLFDRVGYKVTSLKRTDYGIFNVKGIPKGSYRIITKDEIEKFYKTYSN